MLHPIKILVDKRNSKETVPVPGRLAFLIMNGVVLIQTTGRVNTAAVLYRGSNLYWLGNIEVISMYKTKSNLSFECMERYILILLI